MGKVTLANMRCNALSVTWEAGYTKKLIELGARRTAFEHLRIKHF
jgi:hypothetical protein